MWSVPIHETSSGETGASVFDFEGDGAVEVAYADECWARVFDGRTGQVKFSAPHDSATWNEYPVIADVDGDFAAELVVPHNRNDYMGFSCPNADPLAPAVVREPGKKYRGITVYRDRQDRWAPARPLWSEHAEHYSDRLDDGRVPSPEPSSWGSHNSYRQNFPLQGHAATDAPDLTVGKVVALDCHPAELSQPLTAKVCNRGKYPAPAGVKVTFRRDAGDGPVAGIATTRQPLEPGQCADVGCDWTQVPQNEAHDVFVAVDDESVVRECVEGNNRGMATAVRCPPAVD